MAASARQKAWGDIFDGLDVAALGRADLEDQADVVREALARWADSAPGEIRDDVEVLAATVSDLYELLEEHEYDFSALGAGRSRRFALRGTGLSARFNEAAANFERYCGFDLQRPSVAPPQGTSSGGPVILDGELPDGFPQELVPPDSEVVAAGSAGPALTGTFRSTATLDAIREFYEDILGDPNVIDSENFVWSVFRDGQVTAVTVSGTDGDIFIGVSVSGG